MSVSASSIHIFAKIRDEVVDEVPQGKTICGYENTDLKAQSLTDTWIAGMIYSEDRLHGLNGW